MYVCYCIVHMKTRELLSEFILFSTLWTLALKLRWSSLASTHQTILQTLNLKGSFIIHSNYWRIIEIFILQFSLFHFDELCIPRIWSFQPNCTVFKRGYCIPLLKFYILWLCSISDSRYLFSNVFKISAVTRWINCWHGYSFYDSTQFWLHILWRIMSSGAQTSLFR